MNSLNNKNLKNILEEIDSDPQSKQYFSSKWHKIVNFLYNSTGLSIFKVAKAGSIGKLTDTSDSDLDVIFSTSVDWNLKKMLVFLEDKAHKNFDEIANVRQSSSAVQIDFVNPACDIDLVYKTKDSFDKEYKEIKDYRKIKGVQQNSIKIAKFVFYNTIEDEVHGYEVEKACLQFKPSNLIELVYSIIKYFKGRLNKLGFSIDDIIEFLS